MSGQIKLKAASLGGDIALVPTDTASSIVVTIPAVTATLLNDQSNIEAQTKTALNATGSAPVYGCRAWVNFNGTGTVAIRGSGNVSSITDSGVGIYTVNFTTAMPDANYAAVSMAGQYGGGVSGTLGFNADNNIRTTTTYGFYTVVTTTPTSTVDLANISLAFFR
jgi:hypothetical protein